MYKKVLVPIDGSPISYTALRSSLELFHDSMITIFHVTQSAATRGILLQSYVSIEKPIIEIPIVTDMEEDIYNEVSDIFRKAGEIIKKMRTERKKDMRYHLIYKLVRGNAGKEIIKEAAIDYDVIVIGRVSKSSIETLFGSVSSYVVKNAPCSVFVIK
jgi:nucleotide-binding universal stress UspA family protein